MRIEYWRKSPQNSAHNDSQATSTPFHQYLLSWDPSWKLSFPSSIKESEKIFGKHTPSTDHKRSLGTSRQSIINTVPPHYPSWSPTILSPPSSLPFTLSIQLSSILRAISQQYWAFRYCQSLLNSGAFSDYVIQYQPVCSEKAFRISV